MPATVSPGPATLDARPAPASSPSTAAGAPSPQLGKRAAPSSISSPELIQPDPESPRITRSKHKHPPASSSTMASRGSSGCPAASPGPLAGHDMVGLGVGLAAIPTNDDLVHPNQSALQQTRKLNEMPTELSTALSRLSSQHHLSEYNALKRVVPNNSSILVTIPSPAPIRFMPAPHLQRSQSSPPVPTPDLTSYPLPVRSDTLFTTTKPSPLSRNLFRPASPADGIRSLPETRVSTPPPNLAAPQTSLTPTLVNFSFTESNGGTSVAEAMGNALRSDLCDQGTTNAVVKKVLVSRRTAVVPKQVAVVADPASPAMLPGMQIINGVPVKTSASHPMNISPILPPELLATWSNDILSHHCGANPCGSPKPRSPLMPSSTLSSNSLLTSQAPFILDIPGSCNLWSVTNNAAPVTATAPAPLAVPTSVLAAAVDGGPKPLGNFLLSSCPGKKVRLTGAPSRGGRNPICRDLQTDLQRAKDEGVRLIICCLDDQELGFLGAPWEEYERTATSLSLAVVRIPMVEGFAPSSPASLDSHLARVVKHHTLRGESVLAHCRGGIGRAGLVACCWMIKAGFVGAVNGVDPMTVVEQVIEVVRRRRSVKSIETPQQVHFLLEYVEYLKAHATPLRAADVL